MISTEYSLKLQNTVPSIMQTRSGENPIFTPPPSSNSLDAIAIVMITKEIVRDRRLELEKNNFSRTVRSVPMIAPRISENTISNSGSMITETMSRVPPAIACAMPKETENTTSPTASSSATIGSRRSVTGPFALYCLTTINVDAGAVAEAIAPSVIATGKGSTSGPSRKCSPKTRSCNMHST